MIFRLEPGKAGRTEAGQRVRFKNSHTRAQYLSREFRDKFIFALYGAVQVVQAAKVGTDIVIRIADYCQNDFFLPERDQRIDSRSLHFLFRIVQFRDYRNDASSIVKFCKGMDSFRSNPRFPVVEHYRDMIDCLLVTENSERLTCCPSYAGIVIKSLNNRIDRAPVAE